MKCPHCGQEHPETTKFCPETGAKMEFQFLTCKNPDCDFRRPLPMSAKFCPNCGEILSQTKTLTSEIKERVTFVCIEETTSYNRSDSRAKYRFYNQNGILLSEMEFYIVDYTYSPNLNSYDKSFHQLLLMEVASNELFFLDGRGIFYKVDRYDEIRGYRIDRCSSDKWFFEAKIIDEQHILYRRGCEYSLFEINNNDGVVLKLKFSTRLLPNMSDFNSDFKLIGNYICTNRISIRVSDGHPETISGYLLCRCIGYKENEPIFVASEDDDWEYGECDIVDLNGRILWKSPNCDIRIITNNVIEIDMIDFSELYTIDGEYLARVDNFYVYPINNDILRIGEWKYYSISRQKIYIDYEEHGEYYMLKEELSNYKSLIQIYNLDDTTVFSLKVDSDIYDAVEFLDVYNSRGGIGKFPKASLLKTYQGEIVNLKSGRVIYTLNLDNDRIIGTSDLQSRFAVESWPYYNVIDNNGNLLNRIHSDGYVFNMCSNGWLVSDPIKGKSKSFWKVKLYDLELNSYIIDIPRLTNDDPSVSDCIQMVDNETIILISGEYDAILTKEGRFISKNNGCQILMENIYVGNRNIINLQNKIVIKNCNGLIL